MRPRHKAAEIAMLRLLRRDRSRCFNEAAAQSRGNPRSAGLCGRIRRCFNEAAAQSRGNPPALLVEQLRPRGASMRPRHKAAEIVRGHCDTRAPVVASMRPRHKAAEIAVGRAPHPGERETASMRPRHKAAEIREVRAGVLGQALASMRPRHKAAEILSENRTTVQSQPASMRPRHKAAEIAGR